MSIFGEVSFLNFYITHLISNKVENKNPKSYKKLLTKVFDKNKI